MSLFPRSSTCSNSGPCKPDPTPSRPPPRSRLLVVPPCSCSCAEKLCNLRYSRPPSEEQPTEWQLAQQRNLQRRLQQHLQTHYQPHPSAISLSARRVAEEKEDVGQAAVAATHGEDNASVAVASADIPPGDGHSQRAGGDNHRRGGGEDARGLDEANGGSLSTGASGGHEDKGVERFLFSRPWYLRAMGWDCVSECGYSCMTMHVEMRVAEGQRVQQYHGKWPFRRERERAKPAGSADISCWTR